MLVSSAQAALAAETGWLSRGEAAAMLMAAADDYNPGVQKTDILKGYSDGSLHEERPVTRAQALVMLRRAFGGELPQPVGDNARSGYSSANFTDLPAWAAEDLQDVLSTGIVAGTSATTFSPSSYVTESQMEPEGRLLRGRQQAGTGCQRDPAGLYRLRLVQRSGHLGQSAGGAAHP